MQYPAGLGGVFVALGVSVVDSNAPALFSRPSFASLGAVPNIVQGVMHYQALKTESKLYLSPCGHLAIRVDEWPSFPFQWPIRNGEDSSPIEDACTNDEVMLEPVPLVQTSIPSRPPPHASLSSSLSSSATMVAPLETGDATCVGVRPHDSLGSDLLCLDSSASPSQGQCVDAVLSSSDGNYHVDVNLGRPVAVHGSDNQVPQRTWSLQTSFWPTFLRRSRSEHSHLRSVRVPLDAGIGKRSGFDTCNTKGPSNSQDSVVSKRVGSGKDCVRQDGKGTSFKPKLRKLSTGFKWLFPTLFAANWTSQSRTEDIHDIVATQSESTASIPRCPYSLNSHATLGSGGGRTDGYGGRESDLGSGDRNLAVGSSGLVPSSRRFSRRPFESEPGGGRGTGLGELNGVSLGTFSADRPMLKEDVGSFKLKCGTQKRLLGNIKQLKSLWNAEAKVYENRCRSAQQLRGYKHDIVEIFAGMANITAEALARGLNAIQPIDMVHGVKLESKEDFSVLTRLLAERRPFLVVWEIRCDPWSNIQHLNYTQEELEKIRQAQYVSIKGMCDAIQFLKEKFNVHFLLENPWGTPFWQHPEIQKIMQLQDAKLSRGSMCNFELRGKDGMLIKKDTGWLTDLDEIGSKLALPCPGNHQHEVCMGGNSKRAQIYTRQLAKAVVSGLVQALQDRGDERFLRQETSAKFSWACGSEFDEVVNMDMSAWIATRSPMEDSHPVFDVLYLDINRDEESWRPLLQEAQVRLEGKISNSAIVKTGSAFFSQIQDLVPWVIHQAQIVKNPKVRRIPQNLMSNKPITHRAAILRFADGHVGMETKEVKSFSNSRFEVPVAYGVLVYGEAPATSLNPEDNCKPEQAVAKPRLQSEKSTDSDQHQQVGLQPEEVLVRGQPGHVDIKFEVQEGTVPRWVQNALRRLHTNLGHPSNESLVRHLAQAGATGPALLGAKQLRCSVCDRTKPPSQPRPAKAIQSRRFNDRVFLDIVFIKNVNGDTFSYLNILDDASTYQVLDRLLDRSEAVVVKKLVDGWFKYFGFTLTLVVDAEGALRGFKFENLVAQCGIQLRFVPPDAHWQLGKCERHGQAAKWIARKLVNQFAALPGEEMDIVVNMAVHAKNSMVRRCGASPCQWVFGRQPRIPTALLSEPESVEAKSMVDSNDALLQIEMIRHEAMKAFADFEFNQTLRKAMLRKGRPYRGPLEVGQRVAYFRHKTQLDGEGTVEGYRQGLIIGLDPGPTGSVWIRNSRGRVIQAAREQVRGVEGEELWSPNLEDIQALKDAEVDLSDKHPQAFDHRTTAPSAIEDKRIMEALDAAGQPQLSADDSKVFVPVPSPAEIESRRSSKTDTQVSVPSVRASPGTPFIYLPPTPALPARGTPGLGVQQSALPPIPEDDEPNTLKESSKPTSSLLKLEDAPLQLTQPPSTSAASQVGQGVKRSSDVSQEVLREASKIPSSSARGQKREAEVEPHALQQQQIQTEPSRAQQQQKSPEVQSALLAYCKQCGTSNSTIASQEECPRCGSDEFVDDPILVNSWFDEVEEHEAMHQTKDFVFDPYYKRWLDRWPDASGRFDLPRDDYLEESLHSEAFITGVGQVFPQLPEGAPAEETCLWSVATKRDKDSQ